MSAPVLVAPVCLSDALPLFCRFKWHDGCRVEDRIDAPPRPTVEQFPIVPGSSLLLCEQDVARANPKDAVSRRKFELAAQRDDELPCRVRMPSKLWVRACLLDRHRSDRKL